MMRTVLGIAAASALAAGIALSAQAQNTQSGKRPSNAHVAISLGDGTTVESKGKGSPGSVKGSNSSAGGITIYYNPKELTVDKPVPWQRKK